jgi:hypothetical protein
VESYFHSHLNQLALNSKTDSLFQIVESPTSRTGFVMSTEKTDLQTAFQDRRDRSTSHGKNHGMERRQFSDGHSSLSPDAGELGRAVDQYKLENRRRYVSYEELLNIIKSLGYEKKSQ